MNVEELNFKIGDLVITLFQLELAFDEFIIPKGSIGLVVSYIDEKVHSVSGYEYNVLVKGREVAFFERELIPYLKMEKTK